MKKKTTIQCVGIMLPITYIILFAVNSLILYFANLLFPNQIVLGNQSVTYGWSFIHSMGTLAMLNLFLIPLVKEYENKTGKIINSLCWMKTYFISNFIGLWILGRFANELGMGLSSWTIALFLAFALSIAQKITMILVGKLKRK